MCIVYVIARIVFRTIANGVDILSCATLIVLGGVVKGRVVLFLLDKLDGNVEHELCCPYWIGWTKVFSVNGRVDKSRGWLSRIRTIEIKLKLVYALVEKGFISTSVCD